MIFGVALLEGFEAEVFEGAGVDAVGEDFAQDVVVGADPFHCGSITYVQEVVIAEQREGIELGGGGAADSGKGVAAEVVDGADGGGVRDDDDTAVSACAIGVLRFQEDVGAEAVQGEDGDEGADEGSIDLAVLEILEDGEVAGSGAELDFAVEFVAEVFCKFFIGIMLRVDVAVRDQAEAEDSAGEGRVGGSGFGRRRGGAVGEPDERNCKQDKG